MSRRLRGWWRSAGGSESPMFFPKGVPYSHKTSWGDSEAFMLRGSSSLWPRCGSNRVDKTEKGSPGGDFVVARASWGSGRPIVSLKV